MTGGASERREQGKVLQQNISEHSRDMSSHTKLGSDKRAIHMTFIGMLGISGYLVMAQLLRLPLEDVVGSVRFSVSTLGFFFAAVFYIRWADFWLRRRADQELKLQQLALDVDRAGYIAEMLRECKATEGGEMPAVLLDRLSTGLFSEPSATRGVRHPTEDVTGALLKASSRVRVDIPGIGEVTFTGRDIRRADRELAKARED